MKEITPGQRAKERSVLLAIAMDSGTITLFFTAGLIGGSLTMMAEALRGALGYVLECFTFIVLRRIHRGVLVDLEYGSGKLEQVGRVMIGASMLMAAGWIVNGVLHIMQGQRALATPAGLAFSAIIGMVNVYVNVLAWDAVRRASDGTDSLLMNAQLSLRKVKLGCSVVIAAGLTIAALSTDEVVVAWVDALGSTFVAGYLTLSALGVLRTALPDLIDRSAGADVQQVLERALAAHSADYVRVDRLRTRRSGQTTFVEIALGFDLELTMAEVHRRIDRVKATIARDLENSDISIITSAARAE